MIPARLSPSPTYVIAPEHAVERTGVAELAI